jgi:hypothetical protein
MTNEPFGTCSNLPDEIQDIFIDLCQDIAILHGKWKLYVDLFSKSENIEILNDLAPSSFHLIEKSIADDLIISICRLSDPLESFGHTNLSLLTLIDRMNHVHGIKKGKRDFENKCKPVRKYRNKRVGHNDLNFALKPHDTPLPKIPRKTFDEILKIAANIMNLISGHYSEAEFDFQPAQIDDADSLISWLKKGRDAFRDEHGIKKVKRYNKSLHPTFDRRAAAKSG